MHLLCLRLTSSHFIATSSIHFLINVRVDIEMKRKLFYAKIQSVSLHQLVWDSKRLCCCCCKIQSANIAALSQHRHRPFKTRASENKML
jgi:hypothetical protein